MMGKTWRGMAAVLSALAISGVSSAVHAEVKESAANGFTVEVTQLVQAPPAMAWRALVNDVDHWWLKPHRWFGPQSRLSIDPRAGGCFCEVAGTRQAEHMQVLLVEPGKLLRMRGALGPLQDMGLDGVTDIRLQAQGKRTQLTLRYRVGGYAPDEPGQIAPQVDKVLGQQLWALAEYLRKRPGGRAASE